MPDRPEIPHDPPAEDWAEREAQEWQQGRRDRAEAGQRRGNWWRNGELTSPGKRIPHYGRVNEDDQPA